MEDVEKHRSHGSLGRMIAHFRGDPIYIGKYHPHGCFCELADEEDAVECSVSRRRRPGYRSASALTLVPRIVILRIEVGAIFLAITISQEVKVRGAHVNAQQWVRR